MKTQPESPVIYCVAGPNGAGKTTFARRFLPDYADCDEFLNADLIAAGLSPFAPQTQAGLAAELMLQRMDECMDQQRTFGFETTFAGRSYVSRLGRAKDRGYRIDTFFLWLPDVRMALARVAQRTSAGGHHVPDDVVRARYDKGLLNFRDLYRRLSDSWRFLDASCLPPRQIASGSGTAITTSDPASFPLVASWLEG